MDFMDSIFGMEDFRVPDHPVYQALFVDEEYALRALENLDTPLTLREAGRCLRKSMRDCSAEVFRQVLEHSEPGECVEQMQLSCCKKNYGIQGNGSALLLAAMLDRPRQAAMLLEHGYDCNGAGLNLAHSLYKNGGKCGSVYLPYARFCGSAGNQIQLLRYRQNSIGISWATPLSAALLCGSLQTAEVLLRQKNLWKGESSAVCRAAAMVLDGMTREALPEERQAYQLEIMRQVFCPDQERLPERETFLRSVYLQPAAWVDICRTSTLQLQLESGLCTEEDVRQMLQILGSGIWWPHEVDRTRAGKLMLLKKHFPRVCREDWAKGIFLRDAARRIREKLPYKTVLNTWKQLSGKERDLTWIGNDIWALGWKNLSTFLKEAGERGTLVMDADAMNRWYGASARCMGEVLKQVQFRQRDGEGVSGLMQHLLSIRDLRVLRQAAKQGLLDRENPKLLLECLAELENCSQDMRAIALTFARNRPASDELKANWQDPARWSQWCLWELLSDDDAEALLHKLLYRDLPRNECLRTMFRLHQYLDRGVFAPDMPLEHPQYPTMQADSLMAFACCAKDCQAMEILQQHLPEKLLGTVRVNWGEQFFFYGTPLTLAAAMGRTEQVTLLLDSGVHPDEEGRGDCSRFFVRNGDYSENSFFVTPVLAAILFGQEGTAKLLLERGASCDFSRPEHRNVLLKGSAESRKLAEHLPDVGFEKIPAKEWEALRIMTSEQGERTLFWNSLQTNPAD